MGKRGQKGRAEKLQLGGIEPPYETWKVPRLTVILQLLVRPF